MHFLQERQASISTMLNKDEGQPKSMDQINYKRTETNFRILPVHENYQLQFPHYFGHIDS